MMDTWGMLFFSESVHLSCKQKVCFPFIDHIFIGLCGNISWTKTTHLHRCCFHICIFILFFFVALMYASACIQTQRTLKRTHAFWELSKTNTRWSWKRMFGCISKLSAIVMKFETRSMMFPHIPSPLINLKEQRHAKSAFIRHWASTSEDEHAQSAAYQCIRNESV